jgi:carboxymethylenebutenolidase
MRLVLFLFMILTMSGAIAQSCCDVSATDAFADLGAQKRFKKAHAEPLQIQYQGDGEDFTFPVKNGEDGKGFIIRASQPTTKFLFVIHEWWGLNDHVKTEANKFYHDLDNVTVICLDLYDGKVTSDRDEASDLMQAANETRIKSIIQGAKEYVGPRAKVATVGWCFGGGWSMQTSIELEDQAIGCIIYYGMPEKNPERVKGLQADVLGIFASKDNWINGKVVKEFESMMVDLEKNLDLVTFDADHAFANPSNPKHNKKAAREAYDISLEFLHNHY